MLAAAAVARQQRELLGYDTDAAGIIEYTALQDWYGTQRAPSMQQWLDSGGTKAEEISLLSDSDDELVGDATVQMARQALRRRKDVIAV